MTFWLLAGLMVAIAMAAILFPLLRGKKTLVERGDDNDLNVYRDQLTEVTRDLARGVIGEKDAEAARLEIERRLLKAAERPAVDAVRPTRGSSGAIALLLAVSLPLAAFLLYDHLGSPGISGMPFAARQDQPAAEMQSQMISQLETRLANNPQDLDAWLLLGNLYAHLGRWSDAAKAYSDAMKLDDTSLEARTGRAESLVALSQGLVTPEAGQLFARILEQDRQNPSALFYSGLALAQNGRLQDARAIWTALLASSPEDAPWVPALREQLAHLSAALEQQGMPPLEDAPAVSSKPGSSQTDSRQPGPSQEDVEAAGEMTPEDREAFIRSMVQRLANRMAENPDDLDGWLRLARAYLVLGDRVEAEKALAAAEALVQDLPADAPERAKVAAARKALPAGN